MDKTQTLQYTLSDVKSRNSNESAWIIIHNVVYDVTKFLEEHPGGSAILLGECGKDATEAFEDIGHSNEAKLKLKEFAIGILKEANAEEITSNANEKSNKCTCCIS